MSKFKVGDKVWCNGEVKVIKRVDLMDYGEFLYYFHPDDDSLNFYVDDELELYKTPHERLLDMGFIGQEPFWGDYRLYKKEIIIDSLGDMLVVLIILHQQLGLTMEETLEFAWNEIKERKGEMKNGVFVKEDDL